MYGLEGIPVCNHDNLIFSDIFLFILNLKHKYQLNCRLDIIIYRFLELILKSIHTSFRDSRPMKIYGNYEGAYSEVIMDLLATVPTDTHPLRDPLHPEILCSEK